MTGFRRPNGHGKYAAPENERSEVSSLRPNETRHARFPHLNPLPQAGEEANESLREFHVKEWLLWGGLSFALCLLVGSTAHAAGAGLPALTSTPAPGGGQTYSLSLQTLLLLTSLSFLPAILLMMTGFTRIVIVLSLLRSALGTPASPPNQVLVGLSLFLTFFVMAPVFDKIYTDAYLPFSENKLDFQQALEKGSAPLKTFMLRQTREADLALFINISNSEPPQSADRVPLRILVPAYVTSELKTAFQIGFVIFIPFLIIDMVVASVLMSMGMMMVSPAIISLPFKIMLFVLADGWNLVIGSLAKSFYT